MSAVTLFDHCVLLPLCPSPPRRPCTSWSTPISLRLWTFADSSAEILCPLWWSVLTVHFTQSRITWAKRLHEGLRTLGWPVGTSVRDCLVYVNSCGKTWPKSWRRHCWVLDCVERRKPSISMRAVGSPRLWTVAPVWLAVLSSCSCDLPRMNNPFFPKLLLSGYLFYHSNRKGH